MDQPNADSFWYAVHSTEVILMPERRLETFGTTVFHYHMVSELMDSVDRVRVREGRVKAERPKVVAPSAYAQLLVDGFGDQARSFLDWIRTHRKDLRVLQYGFVISKQETSEELYSDRVDSVLDRVTRAVQQKNDPLSAVLRGVDEPWEVCLLKLLVELIDSSVSGNVEDLERRQMFGDRDGVPVGVRREIESAFAAASKDRTLIQPLAQLLRRNNLFQDYEDRFFALVKTARI